MESVCALAAMAGWWDVVTVRILDVADVAKTGRDALMAKRKAKSTQVEKVARTQGTLNVDMVPMTMWGRNVRAIVSNETWEELRSAFRSVPWMRRDYRNLISLPDGHDEGTTVCKICVVQGSKLELHEVWEYDDHNRIQRLINLIAICQDCHLAIHVGPSQSTRIV